MRDEYDFSDAIVHPLAGKFNGKYTVTVHYDFLESNDFDEEINADLEQPMTVANNVNPPAFTMETPKSSP